MGWGGAGRDRHKQSELEFTSETGGGGTDRQSELEFTSDRGEVSEIDRQTDRQTDRDRQS